ncbi:MAG: hypothetical protein N2513_01915 [Deltaproteobacteria bacterium]|nr:hypothetical protein [Deltaproteobacteria bacterium]
MPRVHIEDARPGMITSKPVINESGVVILNEGIELTEEILSRLKNLGVVEISIKATKRPSVPMEELLKKVEDRFQGLSGKPYMDVLKMAVIKHIKNIYEGL